MAWWGEVIIYLLQMFEYLVNDCGPSLPICVKYWTVRLCEKWGL